MISPDEVEEAPNVVSQLARKMQGAGTKGWNRLSALFNRDDEHQLLEESEGPPVADHPLAVKPEEAPPPSKRTGFWDSFAANWAAKKQADAATAASAAAAAASNETSGANDQDDDGATVARGQESQDGQITMEEVSGGGGAGEGQSGNNSFSKYMSLGGGSEEVSFKWNFVTSKLAELKTKAN
uniref:Testis development related protein n=2 Tax=Takifugu TaxID=31032 RepID=A0A674MP21_TAKRU